MSIKAIIGENAKGNVENVSENQRKRNLYYMVAESLVELYPTVMKKEEFVSNALEYLGEISKQYVESRTQFPPTAYGKK